MSPVMERTKIVITVTRVVGDDCEDDDCGEWVVSDDGGEFDDDVFTEGDDCNAEAEARDEATARAFEYQKMGRAVAEVLS